MEKSTIIKGELFIVPNAPFTKEELGWYDIKHWEDWANRTQSMLDNFEGNISVEEPMIQIWAANKACDNFAAHTENYAKLIGMDQRFPTHLPYSLLKGLKEGDTLTLQLKNGVKFELELSQMTHRYPFGDFEEVLENLIK